jgi:hypothetical protein
LQRRDRLSKKAKVKKRTVNDMKRIGVSLLVAVSLCLVAFNSFSEDRSLTIKGKNQRLALVIGNSEYRTSTT